MTPAAPHRQGSITRRLTVWLALLPFVLFSLVLPGTMLARDAAGGVTVVLCSDGGVVEMVMAADGSVKPVSKTPGADHHGCDWALHGQSLMDAGATGAPPPATAMLRLARVAEQPDHLYRAAVRSAPARGPPHLV